MREGLAWAIASTPMQGQLFVRVLARVYVEYDTARWDLLHDLQAPSSASVVTHCSSELFCFFFCERIFHLLSPTRFGPSKLSPDEPLPGSQRTQPKKRSGSCKWEGESSVGVGGLVVVAYQRQCPVAVFFLSLLAIMSLIPTLPSTSFCAVSF